ncbi:hypothetical protein F5Y04DRAFT_289135 [Hypomontagnella monticulosa]|nr:hypothetical protein F5Y04DRAFT_289135 [Hypomontagnella monticulosa]
MQSNNEIRTALSATEQKRRDEVFAALVEKTEFTKADLESIFKRGQGKFAAALVRDDVLPTLSADYFAWNLEKDLWSILLKEKTNPNFPPFPFKDAEPPMYGAPYSGVYLACLAEKVSSDRVAETLRGDKNERKLIPDGAFFHPAALDDAWKKMFGDRPFENGCSRPFVILFPEEDGSGYARACLGNDEKTEKENLIKVESTFGHQKEFLLRAIRSSEDDKRVYVAVDFAEDIADVTSSPVQSRLQRVWFDLLAVNLEWLSGRAVNIVDAFMEVYDGRLSSGSSHLKDEMELGLQLHREHVEASIRQEYELRPDTPERSLAFLTENVRAAAHSKAASFRVEEITALNLDENLALVDEFVSGQRFSCLAKAELAKMVENVSIHLAQLHVNELVKSSRKEKAIDKKMAEDRLAAFVVDPDWDHILPSQTRFEVCEKCLRNN